MSSVLKFALILLMAAVVAMGARAMYVSNLNQKSAPSPDVRIRVTAAELPAGLLLRDTDLAWKTVPRQQVPKGAVQDGEAQPVIIGGLLRHHLDVGAVVHSSDVIAPDAPGFLAAALKPGLRAVSVPVDDVSGNAGLIQPGDYVDMILTQRMGRGGDMGPDQRRVVSETVVQNARIIAVGSSFQRSSESSTPNRARTVTIEVSPRTAEAVTVAAQLGSLSMALRSFATTDRDARIAGDAAGASVVAWRGDAQQAVPSGPVWGSDVSRVHETVPAAVVEREAKPEIPRKVVIMRGREKQEQELGVHAQ